MSQRSVVGDQEVQSPVTTGPTETHSPLTVTDGENLNTLVQKSPSTPTRGAQSLEFPYPATTNNPSAAGNHSMGGGVGGAGEYPSSVATNNSIISPTPFLTFRRGSAIEGLMSGGNGSFSSVGGGHPNFSFGLNSNPSRRDSLAEAAPPGAPVQFATHRRCSTTSGTAENAAGASTSSNPPLDQQQTAGDVSPPQRTRTSSLFSTNSASNGPLRPPLTRLVPVPSSENSPMRPPLLQTTSSTALRNAASSTSSSSSAGTSSAAGLDSSSANSVSRLSTLKSPTSPETRMKSGLLSPPPMSGTMLLKAPAAQQTADERGGTQGSNSSGSENDSALCHHAGLRHLLQDHTTAMANARKQRQQQQHQRQLSGSANPNDSILSSGGGGGANSSNASNGLDSSIGSSYYRRQSTESLQLQSVGSGPFSVGHGAGDGDVASPQSNLSGTNASSHLSGQSGREIPLFLPADLRPPPPVSSPPNPRAKTATYSNNPLSSGSSSPTGGRRRSSLQFAGYGALTAYSFGEPTNTTTAAGGGGAAPPSQQQQAIGTVFGAPQLGRRRSSALGADLTDSLNSEAAGRALYQNPNFGLQLENGLGESGSPLPLMMGGGAQQHRQNQTTSSFLPKVSSAEFCSSVATPTVGLSSLQQPAGSSSGIATTDGLMNPCVLSAFSNENINLNLLDAVQLSRGPTPPSIASSSAAVMQGTHPLSAGSAAGGGELSDTLVLGQGSYSSLPSLNSTRSSLQQPTALQPAVGTSSSSPSSRRGNSNSQGGLESSVVSPARISPRSPHRGGHDQQVVGEDRGGETLPSIIKVQVLPLATQLSPMASASRSSFPAGAAEQTPKSTISSSSDGRGVVNTTTSSSPYNTTITSNEGNED